MLSTPLTCVSIGAATVSATVLASAPGYVAVTIICTGAMFGYCSIGSWNIEIRPEITITNETTMAKIGRLIKKFENIRTPYYFLALSSAEGFWSTSLTIFTGASLAKSIMPSVTTLSPSSRPFLISQSLPIQLPTSTGRN